LRPETKERKVRTPKGSEPANGGAPAFQSLDFRFGISEEKHGDDKCNRE